MSPRTALNPMADFSICDRRDVHARMGVLAQKFDAAKCDLEAVVGEGDGDGCRWAKVIAQGLPSSSPFIYPRWPAASVTAACSFSS